MQKIEITGNLGSDAEFRSENGNEFVTFSVGVTERFKKQDGTEVENTTWHSCVMNGRQEKLMPYLKRGTRVYVRGDQKLRVFNSAKNHCMMAGSSISVREVELIGAKAELVPMQLCDSNGVLYTTAKFYWVQPVNGNPVPSVLFNPRNVDEKYNVDGNGFVTPVSANSTVVNVSTDAAPKADGTNNTADDNVEVY